MAGALRQRFDQQKFGHRQFDRLAFPDADMPRAVEHHVAAHQDRLRVAVGGLLPRLLAAQQGTDAFDQQALRKRLLDIIVRAHAQAHDLVHLFVLRGQEDHRHVRRSGCSGAGAAAAPCRSGAAS